MHNVEIQNLSFRYKTEGKLILKDIDLHVDAGEFVCILGQSGCGKSTLLRLLAGLERCTTGKITVDGNEVKGASLLRGVVFQDYGLFPWMTAGANITLALKKKFPKSDKTELKEKTIELLDAVGLDKSVYKKYPRELSGGMKQRCAIAIAFGIDPPILLMDEPFGALDAVTRSMLQDMVLELWKNQTKRKTIFFVTHDVDEALLLANRIIVLGQSPSNIICDMKIPEGKRISRENQFEDPDVLKMRNELIRYIHRDIRKHIVYDTAIHIA
ncbi:ABC-type nitrate/sulfonate/bicarbonate transport system, ATPase component [Lachnospiraceae bacterium JC7]|nr:ABC-type nitrate/sulfonate/bicarbonate transport system, ATPase component [Lachnospiraceae bacterium JC7]